jgi:apolipoprotein N-acyltransferase
VTHARIARLAAAAASGLLLAASRPPLDLGPLALVALVPLFLAWRDVRPRAAAGLAFVAAVVYHALLLSWVWYFGVVASVALVGILAAYWAAAASLIAWLRTRGLRSPWLTAAVLVCMEASFARMPLHGFSWAEIGYAFHDIPAARALASAGGLPLVSFLAVALNALLADLVVARAGRGRAAVRAGAGIAVVVVFAASVTVARAEPPAKGSLRVAVLQGNDKNRDLTIAEEEGDYLARSHLDLAQQVGPGVDLIVFPESSMNNVSRAYRLQDDDRLAAVARAHDAWVLANATVADPLAPLDKNLNLNVAFRPDGTVEGTYAKRHLVPYGEEVPLRGLVERLVPAVKDQIPRDFSAGTKPGIFDVAGKRVASVICFESAFGYEVRPVVRDGADVIVVSTNNRSYRRSANTAQHVAIGQMRAAETGRPLVQAAISGISASIDADGDIHGTKKLFERGVFETTVTATRGRTPYVRYGEWVMWGSAIAVLACIALALVRRRPAASVDSEPITEAPDRPQPTAVEALSPSGRSSGERA